MKKPRTWRIDNPVYNYSLFVRHGGTVAEANRWANSKVGGDFTKDSPSTRGRCYFDEDWPDHAIWLHVQSGSATVSHEALHSVSHIMRHVGIPLLGDTEEAYCYLLAWTVGEIASRIWK